MKESAGILVIRDNECLLAHSTGSPWWRSYMPPKGGIEDGETLAEAASRGTAEEIGILIQPNELDDNFIVEYSNNRGKIFKRVHIFIYRIDNYSDIGLENNVVPFHQLQEEEINDARFMNAEMIKRKALPRYVEQILEHI